MVAKINIEEFLLHSREMPVIDVRSPGEFRQGHIPGAVNLPLFENEERAIVGTVYKNSGRDAAVLKGLEHAGPKLAGFIKKLHQVAPKREIMVHCWRGGMRSEHMAWLFDQAGFRTGVLEGGYKSYRRFIRGALSAKADLTVIGGLTGSGKTEILHQLSKLGEQVIDLEMLSNHKGSVFGALGLGPQPTNEQFENNIHDLWMSFDLTKRILVEDESRTIGSVNIPDPLFDQMSHATMILVEMGREERTRRLVSEYGGFDKGMIRESVLKISEKLGGTRTRETLTALEGNDYTRVAELVLAYYDKAYMHSVDRRKNQDFHRFGVQENTLENNAVAVLKFINEISER